MTRRAIAAAAGAVVLALATVACGGPKVPDYQAIWTTSGTATSSTPATSEPPVPLSKYLEDQGVAGDPVDPASLPDLTVSMPTPPGWKRRGDPNPASKAVMISKGDNYPAAMLVVFKLRGELNTAEAIKHANTDLPDSFHQLDASTADFNGFPSSVVQGTYELKGARMRSWSRVVLPTGRPPDNQRYLVQLIITSLADQAVSESNDVEAIIRGFVVAQK
ncbi:LpqN/LpqT family lipoprotein [Mycobacterium asiaticum]|uniref:Lipoprotein LpqT n=1 Tax=Mycobacterium asiaticum TaxID=1790 RepID=A0A1A3BZA8_MYCAS|nr:LpqN/LpqT family lipoprotein [Mycobacterium asiaticum]OBI80204.1 hypothetical protein A9X01_02035 [Mycobacterium asiaticum]